MPVAFAHHVAIGDPQAPLDRFLDVLGAHGLLRSRRRLRADVQLVSLGDHFDWGTRGDRPRATREATRLLSWLAAHPPEQVVVLAGNHDLARVGELASVDAATYRRARREADALYARPEDTTGHRAFLARYPFTPSVEVVARDLSAFDVAQRALVTRLLRAKRLRLAHAHRGLLLVHAGVTRPALRALGIPAVSAAGVAAGLNAFLDRRVRGWRGGPLDLSPFHLPGDAAGEGGGALYHRPADPQLGGAEQFSGARPRRFHPSALPRRFPQGLGHIRHKKCLSLMARWTPDTDATDGALRTLALKGDRPVYRAGVQPGALLYFADNGMAHVARPQDYELLDLDARAAFSGVRSGR